MISALVAERRRARTRRGGSVTSARSDTRSGGRARCGRRPVPPPRALRRRLPGRPEAVAHLVGRGPARQAAAGGRCERHQEQDRPRARHRGDPARVRGAGGIGQTVEAAAVEGEADVADAQRLEVGHVAAAEVDRHPRRVGPPARCGQRLRHDVDARDFPARAREEDRPRAGAAPEVERPRRLESIRGGSELGHGAVTVPRPDAKPVEETVAKAHRGQTPLREVEGSRQGSDPVEGG